MIELISLAVAWSTLRGRLFTDSACCRALSAGSQVTYLVAATAHRRGSG